jgi:hypothetical protein
MCRTPLAAAQNRMERIGRIFHIHLNLLTSISNVKKESVSNVIRHYNFPAELVAILYMREVSGSNISRRMIALTETFHAIGEINTLPQSFILKTILVFIKISSFKPEVPSSDERIFFLAFTFVTIHAVALQFPRKLY